MNTLEKFLNERSYWATEEPDVQKVLKKLWTSAKPIKDDDLEKIKPKDKAIYFPPRKKLQPIVIYTKPQKGDDGISIMTTDSIEPWLKKGTKPFSGLHTDIKNVRIAEWPDSMFDKIVFVKN